MSIYLLVAVDLSVKYHSPAQPGETLEMVTHIREMRGARSVWVQAIRQANSQRLVVTAEVTGAFMAESGRPVRVPVTFREKLTALYVPDARRTRERADSSSAPDEESRAVSHRHAGDRQQPDRSPHRTRSWCVCRGRGFRRMLRGIVGVA